jgi:hypothetical protein
MAITKAKILTAVNKRLNRKETDIDQELKAILEDVALVIPVFNSTYETVTVASQRSYPLDLPVRDIISVQIDGDIPLTKIGDFPAYLSMVADDAQEEEPKKYCIEGNRLYLAPVPDKEYGITLTISDLSLNVDSIDLPDRYEELLIEGACYKVLSSYGLLGTEQGQSHLALYRDLRDKLESKETSNMVTGKVAYRDIE